MREQVIAQKVGNRSGIRDRSSTGSAQRPARRERRNAGESIAQRLRGGLAYAPSILKMILAFVLGLLLFVSYRAAASASFFQIREVEVKGTARASVEDVQTLVRRELSGTGVWKADLPDLSKKLQRLPWVRNAVVTRVLPDGIRVRIIERVPRAVVRTSAGRFRWVDDDAVLLGEMNPGDQMPPFFLRGLSEEESETARKGNAERVRLFLELQRQCDREGISDRVSEISLLDTRDVRAQLAGDDSQIELRLGSQDFAERLKHGLDVLDSQRQSARGQFISYVDVSQRRTVVGFTSGAHIAAAVNGTPESRTTAAVKSEKQSAKTARKETKNANRAEH